MRYYFLVILLSGNAFARVYLPKERYFSQAECEPRTFCSILKDYFITEPQLNRAITQPYKRLKAEMKILDDSNDLQLRFFLNSQFSENRTNTYWTTYNGLGLQNEASQRQWNNFWNIIGFWQPINLSNQPDREDNLESEINNYFYLARLNVFNLLKIFLAVRSPDNIFNVITASRNLDLYNFVIPKIQKFFKQETYLYKQKLVSMESILSIYDDYNILLSEKIGNYNTIHLYEPKYYRLKNMVLNSIDAISIEFLDYVESHSNLKDYKVCTKKAYLEEAVKRRIYDLKLTFETETNRYTDNLSGFNFSIGGEVNEGMNIVTSVGYSFNYEILESNAQKLARWDYIIARKNISDDFTKDVELEEDSLNETFLMSQSYLEAYLQAKENREQVYLILKGKIINKLGDKNFKFGFTNITEKAKNLVRVLRAESFLLQRMFNLSNALFNGLSQCALSEEIVEGMENL